MTDLTQSGKAMSQDAMLASLRDIHLPAHAPGGLLAEILMAAGLAGCAALALVMLVRLFSFREKTAGPPTIADQLASAQRLPEADRRVALLHLLRAHAPERFAQVRAGLYRPGADNLAQLEAEVAHLV